MHDSALRVMFVDRPPTSGFMRLDRRALEQNFHVEAVQYAGRPTIGFARDCLRTARRVDAIYVFFASEHAVVPALLAKVLRKPLVLVPAGYDYANLPEHGYGLATQGKGLVPKMIGRVASVILPISTEAMWELFTMVPSASTKTRLGYLSLSPDEWEDPGVERDLDAVVTFGYISESSYRRKGVDRFVAAAAADPDRRYILGGTVDPDIRATIEAQGLANLELTGHLSHDELRRLLYRSGIYAQLSWHESFGMSMAEAMLCGCVPVVSTSHALSEVAGSWAVVSESATHDVDRIAQAAKVARDIDRRAMRDDLVQRFSFERRANTLRDAVRDVVSGAARPRRSGRGLAQSLRR